MEASVRGLALSNPALQLAGAYVLKELVIVRQPANAVRASDRFANLRVARS